MKNISKYICYVILGFVISCSTSGSIEKVNDAKIVSGIKIGVTTQRDVYNLFGEPSYRGTRDGGDTWWAYYHPGSNEGASLSIDFSKDGIVKTLNYINK